MARLLPRQSASVNEFAREVGVGAQTLQRWLEDAVAAFGELEPGAVTTAEERTEHCDESIAGYKKPKYVFFVDELPRNTFGEKLKAELRGAALKKIFQSPRLLNARD